MCINEASGAPKHYVIYDGDCGMCRRTVAWVRRRDIQGLFETVPSQEVGQSIAAVTVTPPMREDFKRAVYVFTADGCVLRAGRAMLFILERIGWGGGWLPRLLARPPFIYPVEFGYFVVARNRNFFSRFMFRS